MFRPLLVVAVALAVSSACGAPGGDDAATAPTASVPGDEATAATSSAPVVASDGDVGRPAVAPRPIVRAPASQPDLAPQYDAVVAEPGPVRPDWVDPSACPASGHAAIVDRAHQWGWLCGDGQVTHDFPLTSARSQPDPGTYSVYAKDLNASSTISGAYSEMTHFVAFTRGKYQGARIAFHSVPTYPGAGYVQPLESVGTPEMFGASAGCIRVLPDDAVAIWDWLAMGDTVTVVS